MTAAAANHVQRTAVVVEDAADMRLIACTLLRADGFAVHEAADGAAGLDLVARVSPDLVLLDLNLPDVDGVEVCRQLRTFSDAYVVMVTGRGEEIDTVVGLSVGADDYVTKPYRPRELSARVAAMLRRPRGAVGAVAPAPPARAVGDVAIDLDAHEVRVRDTAVELTRTEFALLEALSERPGRVLTRDGLLDRVWGPTWFGDRHVVDVHLSNLRRKLRAAGAASSQIETVRGVGYRLRAV